MSKNKGVSPKSKQDWTTSSTMPLAPANKTMKESLAIKKKIDHAYDYTDPLNKGRFLAEQKKIEAHNKLMEQHKEFGGK